MAASDPLEAEEGFQAPDQLVFPRFHATPLGGCCVIEAAQMQHAVDDVAHQFAFPRRAEPASLPRGFGDTYQDFADKAIGAWFTVIERDDVGRAGVPEELFIRLHHRLVIEQADPQFEGIEVEFILQEAASEAPQIAKVHGVSSLTATDTKRTAQAEGFCWWERKCSRCCS